MTKSPKERLKHVYLSDARHISEIECRLALNCRLFARISLIDVIEVFPFFIFVFISRFFSLALLPSTIITTTATTIIFLSSLSLLYIIFSMLNTLKCQDYLNIFRKHFSFSFFCFVSRWTKGTQKKFLLRETYSRSLKSFNVSLECYLWDLLLRKMTLVSVRSWKLQLKQCAESSQ